MGGGGGDEPEAAGSWESTFQTEEAAGANSLRQTVSGRERGPRERRETDDTPAAPAL